MKRFAIAALAVTCLAGPAMAQACFTATAIMLTVMNMNQPPPAPDADTGDYSKIHKVAILCTLSDSMPFGGEGKDGSIDIASWRVSAQLCGTLRKRLAERFEFVDVAVDPVAFAKSTIRRSALKTFLKAQANPGIDAYLVVRPTEGGPSGAGVTLRTAQTAGDATLAVNYEIDIIDAKKFSTVGDAEARLRTREPQLAYYPIVTVKNVDKQALIAGTDPEALERVHQALDWSLELSVVETLRALKIDIALPQVGDHSIAAPPLAKEMSKYRNLGVISAVGGDLRVTTVGFGGNKSAVLPASFSDLDQQIESMAAPVLAHNHVVKPVQIDRGVLANVEISKDGTLAPVAGLAPSNNVDAYVLILRAAVGDGADMSAGGVGLVHWTPALAANKLSVNANMGIAVIDAHTLKVAGVSTLRQGAKEACGSETVVTPGVNCMIDEKKYAPAKPELLSDDAKAETRATLQKLWGDAIPETLFALGLDSAGSPAL